MGPKKVCPRNPELNPVVTCITPHASHNHLANTEKKNSYYVMLHPTCLSHKSLPENPESSKFKFKVQNHPLPYARLAVCGLTYRHSPPTPVPPTTPLTPQHSLPPSPPPS